MTKAARHVEACQFLKIGIDMITKSIECLGGVRQIDTERTREALEAVREDAIDVFEAAEGAWRDMLRQEAEAIIWWESPIHSHTEEV